MTLLPIATRELRIAARSKTARRVRLWTTVVGVAVGVTILISSANRSSPDGTFLFIALGFYAFLMCLLAGVFLTADCISEEKRTGTLGLLFLTDLEGYEVVLGKFAVRALNPLLALLAILPVISLAILVGGVTAGEFWRMALALVATLWFSLATGMYISTRSREAHKASGATLMVLLAVCIGLTLASANTRGTQWHDLFYLSSLPSPFTCFGYSFEHAYAIGSKTFWLSLLFVLGAGAALLMLAGWTIQSSWQDDPLSEKPARAWRSNKKTIRSRLGDRSPLLWLMETGGNLQATVWVVAIGWAALVIASCLLPGGIKWPVAFYGSKATAFLLKVLFAAQACRFFVECRQSGALELLLCTPLPEREVIRVQWKQLRNLFLPPLVVFLIPVCFVMFLQEFSMTVTRTATPFLPLMNITGAAGVGTMFLVSTVTEFLALGETGMWLSVWLKKPALAPGVAVMIVLLVPMFFFCIPDIYYDLVLIAWARRRLTRDFRRQVSEQFARHIT